MCSVHSVAPAGQLDYLDELVVAGEINDEAPIAHRCQPQLIQHVLGAVVRSVSLRRDFESVRTAAFTPFRILPCSQSQRVRGLAELRRGADAQLTAVRVAGSGKHEVPSSRAVARVVSLRLRVLEQRAFTEADAQRRRRRGAARTGARLNPAHAGA